MNKPLIAICVVVSLTGLGLMAAKMTLSTLAKPPVPGAKGAATKPNIKSFEASVLELSKLKSSELRESIVAIKAGQIEAYVQEIDQLINHFKIRNDNLNQFFKGQEAKVPLKTANGETLIPDPPEYASRYLSEIQKLSADFRGVCSMMGPDLGDKLKVSTSLPTQYAQKWNGPAPAAEEILPAMREYNILQATYEVFRDNSVHALDKIAIGPGVISSGAPVGRIPGSPGPGKSAAFYQAIPVEIECRLAGTQIPLIISRILANSKLIFQIRDLQADAIPATDPISKNLKNGFKLKLSLHLLEFTTKKHEADSKALRATVQGLRGTP